MRRDDPSADNPTAARRRGLESVSGGSGTSSAPVRPMPVEWIAAASVLLALAAFGMIRVACGDAAWHLATARAAVETGHWPTTNAFSHTFPEYPLYQQYPLFQVLLYAVHRAAGWAGLSVLICGGWLIVFLLFVRWAGPWRRAALLHLPWMIGLLALQRRMILRPDELSMIWLGCTLLALDRHRRGGRFSIAAVPLIQWAWANSHQLFTLGWAVQLLYLGHLAAVRWCPGPWDRRDRSVRMSPVIVAMLASFVVCLLTPQGMRILAAVGQTGDSLSLHRAHIRELAPIWQRPVELQLAVLCAAAALYGWWRTRRALDPFECGLWALSLLLALSAVRGLVFFGVVSVAVFSRGVSRSPEPDAAAWTTMPARRLRRLASCVTIVLVIGVLHHRWIRPPMILGGSQPGAGRSVGDWPDATLAFLRDTPPPGRMMNMPWSASNAVIWGLPNQPVFVDARFEAYPRSFLLDCIASCDDDAVLDRLLREHAVDWIFADHRYDNVRRRVTRLWRNGGWTPVYADTQIIVLVRDTPATADYVARHRWTPADDPPRDLLAKPAGLRARQRVHFARLLAAFGNAASARAQLALAEPDAAGDPAVVRLVSAARQDLTPAPAGRLRGRVTVE